MHIVLGILGTIVTILVLLKRMDDNGIDIGWLNPFSWQRRRAWQQKAADPTIYSIEDPMEAAALLAFAVAKLGGEVSREEKQQLISLYRSEFSLSLKAATELLLSSSYLYGRGDELNNNLEKVLNPSLESFSTSQAQSTLELLVKVVQIEETSSVIKEEFLRRVAAVFQNRFRAKGKWS
jgi:uncharacterized tellurite resistance protein B-like protein